MTTRVILGLVSLTEPDHRSMGSAEFRGTYQDLGPASPLRRVIVTGALGFEEWLDRGRPTRLLVDLPDMEMAELG